LKKGEGQRISSETEEEARVKKKEQGEGKKVYYKGTTAGLI